MFGFDSRRYQVFWEVVGLEMGSLSLVSTIEELLERKSSCSGLEIEITAVGDPPRWLRNTNFVEERWSIGRNSSLADSGHGV
jgi:hypothetical protein